MQVSLSSMHFVRPEHASDSFVSCLRNKRAGCVQHPPKQTLRTINILGQPGRFQSSRRIPILPSQDMCFSNRQVLAKASYFLYQFTTCYRLALCLRRWTTSILTRTRNSDLASHYVVPVSQVMRGQSAETNRQEPIRGRVQLRNPILPVDGFIRTITNLHSTKGNNCT